MSEVAEGGESSGELWLLEAGEAQGGCCLSPKAFPEGILSLPLLGWASLVPWLWGFSFASSQFWDLPLPGELRRGGSRNLAQDGWMGYKGCKDLSKRDFSIYLTKWHKEPDWTALVFKRCPRSQALLLFLFWSAWLCGYSLKTSSALLCSRCCFLCCFHLFI